MAKTLIPTQEAPASGAAATLTWTAASAADDHYFVNTGNEVLLQKNADASSHVATVVSVADRWGRVGDITMTNAGSGAIVRAGPFKPTLFNQSGADEGNVFVTLEAGADTSVSFAVVKLARI